MNIGSEDMFHLGKDGYLYTTVECGDEWYRWVPIDLNDFEEIRKEAIRNEVRNKIE